MNEAYFRTRPSWELSKSATTSQRESSGCRVWLQGKLDLFWNVCEETWSWSSGPRFEETQMQSHQENMAASANFYLHADGLERSVVSRFHCLSRNFNTKVKLKRWFWQKNRPKTEKRNAARFMLQVDSWSKCFTDHLQLLCKTWQNWNRWIAKCVGEPVNLSLLPSAPSGFKGAPACHAEICRKCETGSAPSRAKSACQKFAASHVTRIWAWQGTATFFFGEELLHHPVRWVSHAFTWHHGIPGRYTVHHVWPPKHVNCP